MPPEALCHTSGIGQVSLPGAPPRGVERGGAPPFCFTPLCSGENSAALTCIKEAPCAEVRCIPRRSRTCIFTDQNNPQGIIDARSGYVAGCQAAHITPRVQGLGFLLDLVS